MPPARDRADARHEVRRHAAGYTGPLDLEVIGAKAYDVTQCAVIAAESRGHMQACLQACGAR